MHEFLQELLLWLQGHVYLTALVVFVTAFVESLIIIGFFVPGLIMLIGIGSLIGAGALPFWPIVSAAYFGAVLGEGLGFTLGHFHSERVRQSRWLAQHQNLIEKSEQLFARYGAWSLVFGRFVGPVRAVLPFAAGLLQFSQTRYWLINVLTALIWAPFYALIPGMLIGAALNQPLGDLWPLGFYLVFSLSLLWTARELWTVRKWLAYAALTLAIMLFLALPFLPWIDTLKPIANSVWQLIA